MHLIDKIFELFWLIYMYFDLLYIIKVLFWDTYISLKKQLENSNGAILIFGLKTFKYHMVMKLFDISIKTCINVYAFQYLCFRNCFT